MIDFSYTRGKISVLHEVLREGGQFGMFLTEVARIGKYSGLFRVKTGHEGRPTGIAYRILAIGFIKAYTPFCQSIHIGRMHQRVAIAAEVGIEVVHSNQKNVGFCAVGF